LVVNSSADDYWERLISTVMNDDVILNPVRDWWWFIGFPSQWLHYNAYVLHTYIQ